MTDGSKSHGSYGWASVGQGEWRDVNSAEQFRPASSTKSRGSSSDVYVHARDAKGGLTASVDIAAASRKAEIRALNARVEGKTPASTTIIKKK